MIPETHSAKRPPRRDSERLRRDGRPPPARPPCPARRARRRPRRRCIAVSSARSPTLGVLPRCCARRRLPADTRSGALRHAVGAALRHAVGAVPRHAAGAAALPAIAGKRGGHHDQRDQRRHRDPERDRGLTAGDAERDRQREADARGGLHQHEAAEQRRSTRARPASRARSSCRRTRACRRPARRRARRSRRRRGRSALRAARARPRGRRARSRPGSRSGRAAGARACPCARRSAIVRESSCSTGR